MIVEWKRFRVASEVVDRFIREDEEIWTPVLAGQAGFLGKEVWHNAERPGDVVVVVRWASRRAWEAVSDRLLGEVEDRFWNAVGGGYEVVAESAYEVVTADRGVAVR